MNTAGRPILRSRHEDLIAREKFCAHTLSTARFFLTAVSAIGTKRTCSLFSFPGPPNNLLWSGPLLLPLENESLRPAPGIGIFCYPTTMSNLPWDNNSWEVAAQIAARRRQMSAAVRGSMEATEMPDTLRASAEVLPQLLTQTIIVPGAHTDEGRLSCHCAVV